MPKPIAIERRLTLPFAVERLWPLICDTHRLDRAIGLPEARVTRSERAEGGEVSVATYAIAGIALARWLEYPFEWERPRRYSVVREYDRGPLRRYSGGVELRPADGGTEIRLFSEFTPRHRLYEPAIRFGVIPVSVRRTLRQYRAIGAYLAGQRPDPYPTLVAARSRCDVARLDEQVRQIEKQGVAPEPLRRLRRMLAEAADEDVAGMRPLELAREWGTDPRETLELFLRATVTGLLELRWELLCPGCRGVKAEATRLRELTGTGYCPACSIQFSARVDEAIEARFYPAPAVRRVDVGTYCVGNPMSTPHRLAQVTLAAAGSHLWELDLPPGPYVLRSPQSRGLGQLTVATGGPAEPVEFRIGATELTPDRAVAGAGKVAVRLVNETAHPVTVALDDARWSELATTPGRLMVFPTFRSLFSSEALAPGVELAIGRVGLLFTDLVGSTALYERAGDARAFRLVGEHFVILRRAIEEAGGTLVKTIGDAVMAAFPDGRGALAAGIAIQRAIRGLDTGGLADPSCLVKVGVHAGACFAVTLNERLDYFGTAVNLTARAEHEARGGDVVATAAALADAGDLLAAEGLGAVPFEILLRGFSAPVRLFRIDVAGQG